MTVPSTNGVGKTGQQQETLMELDHFLTIYTKSNSKCMKDLNVRQKTIKILEGRTGNNLFDIGRSNFLPDMSPEARRT